MESEKKYNEKNRRGGFNDTKKSYNCTLLN